jgi:hypothetical protein
MGLTSWKNSPDGRILQSDVTVAKNYLSQDQIRKLERDVSSYFDYVERLLEDEHLLGMADFVESIDNFLSFNRYDLLIGNGRFSKREADQKAIRDYQDFNKTQKIQSDFDRVIGSIE